MCSISSRNVQHQQQECAASAAGMCSISRSRRNVQQQQQQQPQECAALAAGICSISCGNVQHQLRECAASAAGMCSSISSSSRERGVLWCCVDARAVGACKGSARSLPASSNVMPVGRANLARPSATLPSALMAPHARCALCFGSANPACAGWRHRQHAWVLGTHPSTGACLVDQWPSFN